MRGATLNPITPLKINAGAWRPAGGLLAAVLLFELILRHMYFGTRTWRPGVGWGHYDTELRRYFFEGGSTSRWDGRGARVIPGPTPAGRPILAIGNSYTQGTTVDDSEVYTALLQSSVGMPVLNVGHDAQNLAEHVYAAPHHLATLNVAWTIVQVNPQDFEQLPDRPGRARFKLVNRALDVEPPYQRLRRSSAYTQPLRRSSALVNVGLMRFEILKATPMPRLFRAADPIPEKPPRRYGPVELQLGALRDAYRGRVTMFLIPDFLESETSMERRFAGWCAANNVSCITLRTVFPQFERRGRAPTGFANHSFAVGHLNVEGNRVAAKLLTAEIQRLRARGVF